MKIICTSMDWLELDNKHVPLLSFRVLLLTIQVLLLTVPVLPFRVLQLCQCCHSEYSESCYSSVAVDCIAVDCVADNCVQVENKNMTLLREKAELQSQLEENEEDMSELMKKYKAAVQQVNTT